MRGAASRTLPDKNAPAGRRGGGGGGGSGRGARRPALRRVPRWAAVAPRRRAGARLAGPVRPAPVGGGRGGLSVGEDTVDWPAVFAAAKIGGMKNFFIEQAWDLTVKSAAYLKTLTVASRPERRGMAVSRRNFLDGGRGHGRACLHGC